GGGRVWFVRRKRGLLLLQEVLAGVRRGRAHRALVMGGSGGELHRLRQNAARLGIEKDSFFIPATADVADWMRAMDVFVLPSYSEAFSNSMLEAMACGCCTIGSRVGGTPELTGDHERGLLFNRVDRAGLAQPPARAILDDNLRREVGARAARFAHEHLSIETAAR